METGKTQLVMVHIGQRFRYEGPRMGRRSSSSAYWTWITTLTWLKSTLQS